MLDSTYHVPKGPYVLFGYWPRPVASAWRLSATLGLTLSPFSDAIVLERDTVYRRKAAPRKDLHEFQAWKEVQL